jgi:hypothetical protein
MDTEELIVDIIRSNSPEVAASFFRTVMERLSPEDATLVKSIIDEVYVRQLKDG